MPLLRSAPARGVARRPRETPAPPWRAAGVRRGHGPVPGPGRAAGCRNAGTAAEAPGAVRPWSISASQSIGPCTSARICSIWAGRSVGRAHANRSVASGRNPAGLALVVMIALAGKMIDSLGGSPPAPMRVRPLLRRGAVLCAGGGARLRREARADDDDATLMPAVTLPRRRRCGIVLDSCGATCRRGRGSRCAGRAAVVRGLLAAAALLEAQRREQVLQVPGVDGRRRRPQR